jgi:hypothetical protein
LRPTDEDGFPVAPETLIGRRIADIAHAIYGSRAPGRQATNEPRFEARSIYMTAPLPDGSAPPHSVAKRRAARKNTATAQAPATSPRPIRCSCQSLHGSRRRRGARATMNSAAAAQRADGARGRGSTDVALRPPSVIGDPIAGLRVNPRFPAPPLRACISRPCREGSASRRLCRRACRRRVGRFCLMSITFTGGLFDQGRAIAVAPHHPEC